jgi:hypothetical protein
VGNGAVVKGIKMKKNELKINSTIETLKQLLTLQRDETLFSDNLSYLGIELIGERFKISGSYALLNIVFDMAGIPQDTYEVLRRKFPKEDPEKLFKIQQRTKNSYSRDDITDKCMRLLIEKNDIEECIKLIFSEAQS